MCEQTEINYLDGEVVWVKLGACWWPGQVIGYENLPEDIQIEFRKKQLIAAVKFFQEETYEFVRNLKQIYKYNCTQKEDFIRKGLDKYRSKIKDGANYMDKFPGDVEMAEKLTNGNPNILKSEKFSPEEKPDIASLFGEKKLPKKKRDKDNSNSRRSSGNALGNGSGRKITHPRFLRSESDHEIRIRQQSSVSLPTTPNFSRDSQLYSCPLCNFTSTRVNVIICHNKSHRDGGWQSPGSCSRSYTTHQLHQQQQKGRLSLGNMSGGSSSPKRKYVRKNKSLSAKIISSRSMTESIKRKHTKQIEKTAKKKKSDPELREKLLADWDDETDDEDFDSKHSTSTNEICNLSGKDVTGNSDELTNEKDSNDKVKVMTEQKKRNQNNRKDTSTGMYDSHDGDEDDLENDHHRHGDNDGKEINSSEKLFRETESRKFLDKSIIEKPSLRKLKNNKFTDVTPSDDQSNATLLSKGKLTSLKKLKVSSDNNKEIVRTPAGSDDKKSKLSCFDFNEEELEPAIIAPVRKIPRVFGEKNTSLKKEIIKEFAMNQALQNERANEEKLMKNINSQISDRIADQEKLNTDRSTVDNNDEDDDDDDDDDDKLMREVNATVNEASDLVAKIASETKLCNVNEPKCEETETKLEIVEIIQVEEEKDNREISVDDITVSGHKIKSAKSPSIRTEKTTENLIEAKEMMETSLKTKINEEKSQVCNVESSSMKFGEKKSCQKIVDDCDRVTIEEEDDTLPISQLTHSVSDNSEITDVDGSITEMGWSQLSEIIGSNTSTAITTKETTATLVTASGSKSVDAENTADKIDEIEKPTPKRQRGRPRKIHPTTGVSDNGECPPTMITKDDEHCPGTPGSQDVDHKTSEADIDRSYTGRKRIPNKKYLHESGIYTYSPGRRTPRTDDSQSETEESRPQSEHKGRRGMKSEINVQKSVEECEYSNQNTDNVTESTSFSTPSSVSPTKSTIECSKRSDVVSPIHINKLLTSGDIEIRENIDDISMNTLNDQNKHVEFDERIGTIDEKLLKGNGSRQEIDDCKNIKSIETKIDMLPPKKSQIKKFEMSQVVDDESDKNIVTDAMQEFKLESVVLPVEPQTDEITVGATNMDSTSIIVETNVTVAPEIVDNEITENQEEIKSSTVELQQQSIATDEQIGISVDDKADDEKLTPAIETIEHSEMQQQSTVNSTMGFKNDYQEDATKATTILTDSLDHTTEVIEAAESPKIEEKNDILHDSTDNSLIQHSKENTLTVQTTEKVLTEEKIEAVKSMNEKSNIAQIVTNVTTIISDISQSIPLSSIEQSTFVDLNKKSDDSNAMQQSTVLTSSSLSDVSVPVKKREKPRIIENVQLKEPMQILKSKLLEKQPIKLGKHKLEHDSGKKTSSSVPQSKMMKIDMTSNKKTTKGTQMSLTQKLQVLKDEEAATDLQNDKISANSSIMTNTTSPTIITTATTEMSAVINMPGDEKFIQQTSSILEDMELDINSIPFVLSEDLNPDSIEQMPVMISTIVPSSSNIPTTMAVTASKTLNDKKVSQQLTHQLIASQTEKINVTVSPTKRKIASPAILKNKGKAKPTITSIRTLNPPLTGGVKGLKFQNTPTGKVTASTPQKSGTPGKYVIVQAASGQQVRYTVQGKSGVQQKFAIPVGKTAGNPQIVQQGNKVVILTSPSSGQTKMVPLSMPKRVGGNVQKIISPKVPAHSQISSSNVASSKGASFSTGKSDTNSPTTSKLSTTQKIINQSNIVTSKGMVTSLTGSKLLGTLPTGLMKSNYTPLTNTPITGKTLIGNKTLITTKGTILSQISSGQTGNKTVLAPIPSLTLSGKTFIPSQNLVPSKGTVLTPITGQQVKAIAAKNPGKNAKIQYQQSQQKIQLPISQKSPKISVSTALPVRVSGTLKSSSCGGTLVFQNVSQPSNQYQQRTPTGKKIVRQHTITSVRSPQTPTTTQQLRQTVASPPLTPIQRLKSSPSSINQKIAVQRNARTLKPQQKIVVQNICDNESLSPISNVTSPAAVSSITTKTTQQKSVTPSTSRNKNQTTKNQQKSITSQLISSPTVTAADVVATVAPSINTVEMIQQVCTNIEKPPEEVVEGSTSTITLNEITQKVQQEDSIKMPTTQPQIMALPTESSDGTQTYVLVTIDEQGQIHPLDNNTLMSLEGTTQNPDGTRTLYIDPSSFGESGNLDNIVLQFDNNSLSSLQTSSNENSQQQPTSASTAVQSENFLSPNQDILAAALANTDFQQEIGLPEIPTATVIATTITQTSLINQTILQSTIIPTSDPISSPSVLETSLTLNQPIMTPLEVPSSVSVQSKIHSSTASTSPTILELPMTIQSPNIPFITCADDSSPSVQIPGNSMPDIGEIIDGSSSEITQTDTQTVPTTTQYLVLPTLDGNIQIQQRSDAESTPTASYSVSIPNDIVIDSSHVQTTPSMPIIDDTYADNDKFSTISMSLDNVDGDNFNRVSVPDMSMTKSQTIEQISQRETDNLLEDVKTIADEHVPLDDSKTGIACDMPIVHDVKNHLENVSNGKYTIEGFSIDLKNNSQIISSCKPPTTTSTVEESCMSSESSNIDVQSSICEANKESTKIHPHESESIDKMVRMRIDDSRISQENCDISFETSDDNDNNNNNNNNNDCDETGKAESSQDSSMTVDLAVNSTTTTTTVAATPTTSLVGTSQERPSQSYEQFEISEIPTQSVSTKSENMREATQSLKYESMETDEHVDDSVTGDEPPTQSFDDIKTNEASQSYATNHDNNTNTPTQSFSEVMSQFQNERLQSNSGEEIIDDMSFPTQSYNIGKIDNVSENLETDGELSHEGNIPSQSNDITNDDGGIGTSSTFSINNTGLNEDETASSSYVPETPETQERDQDQESAISTSSYEIPTCEEINIASSSIIPDTSIRTDHTQSVHDNGIPEIPTSSYNLNPDSSSSTHRHTDAVPSSSYEDQAIVEQNVSTSYEIPISMPGLEENLSQNFVSESTDHTNQPSSYYAQHVEDVTSEASQSYFIPGGPSTSCPSQDASPSYYEQPPTESEASQSFYSHDIEETQQSSSASTTRNIDDIVEVASQSFYQEASDELKLGQQGEATPTYTERYPVDYTLENSPIDRHDLVESSVSATTQATERVRDESHVNAG